MTGDNMATPCPVNTIGTYLTPPLFKVANPISSYEIIEFKDIFFCCEVYPWPDSAPE